MQKGSKVKESQKINNEIPMVLWEMFEDLYLMEKSKDPYRKLRKKDFFITIFKSGVKSWLK